MSSYIVWDSISSDNVIIWENLLFPLLTLVGDQAPRKDDGTDFGCAWIQSNGLIGLEIKCYCRRFVNSCGTMLILGVSKGFLTNLCYFPKNANSIRCCF